MALIISVKIQFATYVCKSTEVQFQFSMCIDNINKIIIDLWPLGFHIAILFTYILHAEWCITFVIDIILKYVNHLISIPLTSTLQ